jgi:hypothetical protein
VSPEDDWGPGAEAALRRGMAVSVEVTLSEPEKEIEG